MSLEAQWRTNEVNITVPVLSNNIIELKCLILSLTLTGNVVVDHDSVYRARVINTSSSVNQQDSDSKLETVKSFSSFA